ncbi:MAG: hypothetical protein OEL89_04350, partial [Candidatus Peregrinibacteria bacterium]|nr:hypothetical protein [Candidatus Peregrinibacteria bacterium]
MLRGRGVIDKYVFKHLTGRASTSSRSKLNRFGGFPDVSYQGELHPISLAYSSKRGMVLPASNSYLGPNTNVEQRLRDKTPALPGIDGSSDSPDKAGEAHDLRFLTAENTDDLRKADEKFKSKMRYFAKTKEKYNPSTWIGLGGIELKNRLEDSGQMSKMKFFAPTKNPEMKELALRRLKELEQQGYGLRVRRPKLGGRMGLKKYLKTTAGVLKKRLILPIANKIRTDVTKTLPQMANIYGAPPKFTRKVVSAVNG